ncbi:aspartic peptidase domain-containing protein [Suillus fuscotomentosus]|uniref:Aspartic peptidase domain-containing protein n=1 Tax=Suillus fuscotomentosus TaxID=1912939 RepID=A0AAD4HNQ3_9AGAM|nr:aspartic peptidase domain-containing protein [Suillus fuscotomentosus]KAG1904485.1 aspartic peptidase domain-containing protein [Suillus fuscotomentosus]
MFPAASLLTIIFLALSIAGSPVEIDNSPITLPIARRLNVSDGPINLLQQDKARLTAFKDNSFSTQGGRTGSTPVTNAAVTYLIEVGIGSPATTYNLIVDTGSSNTWVGANTKYVKTKTSVDTGEPVAVTYGSGSFSGTEYIDTITLGSGLTIAAQSIGVASTSTGFTDVDGILGIGPVDLTNDTLINEPTKTIPTVTDNLYSQGTISQKVVGISFEPTTSKTVTNGGLTFGGTDATKYTGSIGYTPITTTYPSSTYWGINQSISYGSTTIMSSTAGIVDTGTTFVYIASDAYAKYQSATGGTPDTATGLLLISSSQYKALKNLNFHIGSETYALTPNAQIWPRSLNSYVGGSSNAIYLMVSDIGTPSGSGFDFVNGYTFLERFYFVFDAANSRVGFAETSYTGATTN